MKRPIHILLTTLLILFVSVLSSCVKEERFYPEQDPTRVLLVYVGTDNNLAGYEQEKLQGIRDGWTGKSTDRIIAYIDKAGADARLIEISNLAPGEQPRELAVYGRENSASAETLSRVISFVTTNYPADSYGLLVFSHASGWLPSGALTNPTTYGSVSGNQTGKLGVNPTATRNTTVLNDIALSSEKGLAIADSLKSQSHFLLLSGNGSLADDAKGHQSHDPQTRSIITDGSNEMELRDFAAAIPDGVFDYIVFETCFMAGIEVAYELRHKAPYIFASSAEIVHPGFAPVYSTSTAKLIGGNLAGFGQGVFSNTLTYSEDDPLRSATYSVIQTDGLDVLAAFVRDNCDFSGELNIYDIQHFDRLNGYRLFFDFEDYYGRLLPNDTKRAELSRLIASCVTWKAATATFMTQAAGYNGFVIKKHSGLTTYIPQERLSLLNTSYRTLQWSQATNRQ